MDSEIYDCIAALEGGLKEGRIVHDGGLLKAIKSGQFSFWYPTAPFELYYIYNRIKNADADPFLKLQVLEEIEEGLEMMFFAFRMNVQNTLFVLDSSFEDEELFMEAKMITSIFSDHVDVLILGKELEQLSKRQQESPIRIPDTLKVYNGEIKIYKPLLHVRKRDYDRVVFLTDKPYHCDSIPEVDWRTFDQLLNLKVSDNTSFDFVYWRYDGGERYTECVGDITFLDNRYWMGDPLHAHIFNQI